MLTPRQMESSLPPPPKSPGRERAKAKKVFQRILVHPANYFFTLLRIVCSFPQPEYIFIAFRVSSYKRKKPGVEFILITVRTVCHGLVRQALLFCVCA